jgi:hypothetical protein
MLVVATDVVSSSPLPLLTMTAPPAALPATIPTMGTTPIPPAVPAAMIPPARNPGGRAGAPARTALTTISGTLPSKSASIGSLRRHSSLLATSGVHSLVRAVSKETLTASM